MPYSSRFSYYISPGQTPVSPDSVLWRQPLPRSRHLSDKPGRDSIGLGEYFQALRAFLENNDYEILCRAFAGSLQQVILPLDIHEIRIGLEKHGEFYHPARIDAFARHQKISLVINVAVSEPGLETIKREYRVLVKLNDAFSPAFIPRVYGSGVVDAGGHRKIRMFVGQWFEGYHEFHISRDPADNQNKILVWDDAHSRFFLSREKSADLYRQAARILTYYYDIESFEQIHSWHHGAGDFVVKIDNGDLDLRLITVRAYGSLFANLSDYNGNKSDVELTLQALLIFLINLSVRMRLDRFDGVGDIVWADRQAAKSTLAGFFDALAQKPRPAYMPDSIDRCFRYYLSICTKEDLYDLSQAALNTFNRQAPEVRVIKQHLKEHADDILRFAEQLVG